MGGIAVCMVTVNDSVAVDDKDVSDWSKEVSKDAEKNTVDTNLMGTLEDTDNSGCGVYTTINLVITILTYGVAIAATVGLVITAIIYITSGDNAARLSMAKTRALEIVVGLGIYAVMWSLAQWLIPGGLMNDGSICEQASNSTAQTDDDAEKEEKEAKEATEQEEEEIIAQEEEETSGKEATSGAKVASGKKGSAKGSGNTNEKRYNLNDKKVLIEGDSIQTKTFGAFLTKMAKSLGAKSVENNAVRGSTLAYKPDGKAGKTSVYYRISQMSDEELMSYDYILISAGTNDWYKYFGIDSGIYWNGNHTDFDYDNTSTTLGAAASINNRIAAINADRTDGSTTKIIWFSPIYRYLNAGEVSKNTKPKDCDKVKNKYGKTLADYRRAIREAGGIYISGTAISKKKEVSSKSNLRDWLHPTESYAKTLAKRAAKNFEQLNNGELRIDCYMEDCSSGACKCPKW